MAAAHDQAAHHPNEATQILADAGSDPSLLQLTKADVSSNKAPIELLGEFLRCLMNEEYKAARLLCNKVLELESSNIIASEFVSTIEERIRLDEELDTESSSGTSSNSSCSSSNSSSSSITSSDSSEMTSEEEDSSSTNTDNHFAEHANHHDNCMLTRGK